MDPQISQVRRPANDPGKVQEQCEKKKTSLQHARICKENMVLQIRSG